MTAGGGTEKKVRGKKVPVSDLNFVVGQKQGVGQKQVWNTKEGVWNHEYSEELKTTKKKKSTAITVFAPTPISNNSTSWACRSARPLADKKIAVSNAVTGASTNSGSEESSSSSTYQNSHQKGKGKGAPPLNFKSAAADYYRFLEEERRKGNFIEDTFKMIQENPDAALSDGETWNQLAI